MSISKAIRLLRSEIGMTQMDLATALHMSFTTVNRWENGKMRPTKKAMNSILDIAKDKKASNSCMEYLNAMLNDADGFSFDTPAALQKVDATLVDQMFKDIPFAISVCDAKSYDILYLNQVSGEYVGKPIEQAVGKKCYEYWFDKEQPCPSCHVNCTTEESFLEREVYISSVQRYYEVRVKKVDWKGRKAHIEYVWDTTDRKRNQERLTNVLRHIPGGVCLYYWKKGELTPLLISNNFWELYGFEEEQSLEMVTGLTQKLIHPEDFEEFDRITRAAFDHPNEEKSVVYRLWNEIKGCYRWLKMEWSSSIQPKGDRYYYVRYSDVTKEKKMEEIHPEFRDLPN